MIRRNESSRFCCSVNIPHGFQYVPNETHKIVYSLDCVSVVTETCRKTIQVDGYGPVEVTFNLLKVVGCTSYIANTKVEGDCSHNCDYDAQKKHHINLCCSDAICVDNVLKCSIACLPHYEINCHNVVISDFQVKPVQDHGCNSLHFTGNFEFKYIPHS
ncbi:ABC transporter permease [Bacillus cereus]|uniref:ABC transporter permease n=1 Tax=Bacillus cereus TaxID=1396 RepID=UPI0011435C3D